MVILFKTKCVLFVYMYIDLSELLAYKLFENSDADLSWLLFLNKSTCLKNYSLTTVKCTCIGYTFFLGGGGRGNFMLISSDYIITQKIISMFFFSYCRKNSGNSCYLGHLRTTCSREAFEVVQCPLYVVNSSCLVNITFWTL